MKILALGCLILSSSAFSQELKTLTVTNSTYPENKMVISCSSETCEELKVTFSNKEKVTRTTRLFQATLDEVIAKSSPKIVYHEYEPYDLTEGSIENLQQKFNEGYYGKAVGNALLTIPSALIDTAALPVAAIFKISNTSKPYSRGARMAALKLEANFTEQNNEMRLKQKFYRKFIGDLFELTNRFELDSPKAEALVSAAMKLEGDCKVTEDETYYKVVGHYFYKSDRRVIGKVAMQMLSSLEDGKCKVYESLLK